MNEFFSIGVVSELLNIPASTLRFWEDKGLIATHKLPNGYRGYVYQDLTQIANVIFLRNLGVPVSKVSQFTTYSLDEYADHITTLQKQLLKKLQTYQDMLTRSEYQIRSLNEVLRLSVQEPFFEPIPFEAVEPFDYLEKEKIIRYIQQPSQYVRYFDTRDMQTETRCIIVPPEEKGSSPLWRRTPEQQTLVFLIREMVDQNFKSDVEETLSKIQKTYRTQHLLAQYLVTANENGEMIDYLKGYVEVQPR